MTQAVPGWPLLLLIPAGTLSFYHHLVGTFVYCRAGEKNALHVCLTQAGGRGGHCGQRTAPSDAPVICVLVCWHRGPWRRVYLEEVAFELNNESNKIGNGGNETEEWHSW